MQMIVVMMMMIIIITYQEEEMLQNLHTPYLHDFCAVISLTQSTIAKLKAATIAKL